MGDSLKLSKDKRHRSSSSLAGVAIEGTRSERKLDIRASIPEVDDQFALAEARCDDLHEKIELVKGLKRKRKLKKRSMTRLSEAPAIPDVPFISVRAQPKKKVSQQATRLRQLEMPQNPTRAYVDPARVEQHRMISQVRASQMYREPIHERARKQPVTDLQQVQSRYRRDCADGDSMLGEASRTPHHQEVACEADENNGVDTINMHFDRSQNKRTMDIKKPVNSRLQNIQKTSPKKPVGNQSQAAKWKEPLANTWRLPTTHVPGPRRQQRVPKEPTSNEVRHKLERGSIVELFAKDKSPQKSDTQSRSDQRDDISVEKMKSRVPDHQRFEDQTIDPVESSTSQMKEKVNHRLSRRVKYRSRRYELPTVSSQMKQTGARYYCFSANQTHIPFIVSKSTAPSHNIGVNIQQVLNGIKIQQPLSGIPFTIAHHMGLGHLPFSGKHTNNTQPSLDNREMNVIRLGARLVRLPSYKYMSYNRLLSLYREGDGMVSRFLRAISRPHYFYNSMCNLATRENYDGATSKGHGATNEAKQSLAEYASLYREYEQLEKLIKDGNYEPELERRRDELARELTAREDHIRKVMQEYRAGDGEQNALRGSASTAADNYRHSTFKLNLGDAHL